MTAFLRAILPSVAQEIYFLQWNENFIIRLLTEMLADSGIIT